MKKILSLILFTVTLVFVIAACSSENEASSGEEVHRLAFPTGGQQGAAYSIVAGIEQLVAEDYPNIQIDTQTGGASENNRLVGQGEADLGWSSTDGSYYAYNGEREFEEKQETIRAVTNTGIMRQHLVTLENSGIESIQDLEGKTISLGAPGTVLEIAAKSFLEKHGLYENENYNSQYLSFAEASNSLKDGNIDAAFMQGTLPVVAATELSTTHDVKFLPYDENPELFAEFLEEHPYWSETTIPAGTYESLEEDITVLGLGGVIIAHENVDEDVIYAITKTIFERTDDLAQIHPAGDEFTLDIATEKVLIPFHEGAKKYLEEQGIEVETGE